jgi:hypothetical protein
MELVAVKAKRGKSLKKISPACGGADLIKTWQVYSLLIEHITVVGNIRIFLQGLDDHITAHT